MVVTSADTVTLLFFASATSNSFRANGFGWLVARALYVNWDLDDMVMAGLGGEEAGGLGGVQEGWDMLEE